MSKAAELARLKRLASALDGRARANSGDAQMLYRDRADQVGSWIEDFQAGWRIQFETIEPAVREFEKMCGY